MSNNININSGNYYYTITGSTDTIINWDNTLNNIVYPQFHRKCGCVYFNNFDKEVFNLFCFGCEKPLCSNCCIVTRKKNLAGIWCKDCEGVGNVLPLTKKEMTEKLLKTIISQDDSQEDQETET